MIVQEDVAATVTEPVEVEAPLARVSPTAWTFHAIGGMNRHRESWDHVASTNSWNVPGSAELTAISCPPPLMAGNAAVTAAPNSG